MGDVLRTTSLLPALKEKYPNCDIDWVTKAESIDLVKNNSNIRDLFELGNSPERPYDLVINFDDELAACELASSLDSKQLIGAYIDGGKRTYTDDSRSWFDMGLISKFGKEKADELKAKNERTYQDIHFSILELAEPKKYPPQIIMDDKNTHFAKDFASQNGIKNQDKVIGINTGSGGRWKDKKLSENDTVKIIKNLQSTGAKIILFGGPEEKDRNKEILDQVQGVIDAGCDNSILDFTALVDLCDVLLTSDSLAMHIGISLRKKIVAFFYPTSAAEIELYDNGKKIIGEGESYCSYQAECEVPPKWNVDEISNAIVGYVK